MSALLLAAEGAQPAGGAAIGEVVLATGGGDDRHRRPARCSASGTAPGKDQASSRTSPPSPSASPGCPGWAALPLGPRHRFSAHAPSSACTGTSPCTSTRAATRGRWPTPRTTSSSSGSSASSPPGSSRWSCRRRRSGPTAVRIQEDWYAPLGGDPGHRLRRLQPHRLPARRRLAPAVRPGRDALGPDAPHAHRRRLDDPRRPRRAAHRGTARERRGRRGPTASSRGPRSRRRSRSRAACSSASPPSRPSSTSASRSSASSSSRC